MDKPEREATTKYAKERIETFLKDDDYVSALLLASIYLTIRLRSLLADHLSPPKSTWEETSELLGYIGFHRLVSRCNKLGLLKTHKPKDFDKLWKMRNIIAHESRLWKKVSDEEKTKIDRFCKSAIEFLEKTNS